MTPEEIQALIDAAVAKALGDVEGLLQPVTESITTSLREYLDGTVATLEDRLVAIEEVATAPSATAQVAESVPDLTPERSPLEARLAELEAQLKAAQEAQASKEAEAQQLRFSGTLSSTLDSFQPTQKALVEELLRNRLQATVKETSQGFLTKDGKTLQEVVKGFFDTDEGRYFLPSDYQDGAGVKQPEKQVAARTTDLDAALLSEFAG